MSALSARVPYRRDGRSRSGVGGEGGGCGRGGGGERHPGCGGGGYVRACGVVLRAGGALPPPAAPVLAAAWCALSPRHATAGAHSGTHGAHAALHRGENTAAITTTIAFVLLMLFCIVTTNYIAVMLTNDKYCSCSCYFYIFFPLLSLLLFIHPV